MRYKAALMSCAALVAATCLLNVLAGQSRPGVPPALREGALLRRSLTPACDAALKQVPAPAPAEIGDTILNSEMKNDVPSSPAAVPEASSAVAAPGGPIEVSTGPLAEITPTTLGVLPARF
ncbi:MAG: hypothetical protein NTY77_16480 [Elusimicrobia bacterium]|nr:hypothetical protein [Elusimicrobiota bacterium]